MLLSKVEVNTASTSLRTSSDLLYFRYQKLYFNQFPYVCVCLSLCVSLYIFVHTPHQRDFSLQEMDSITENHNQLNFHVLEPNPSRFIYKTTHTPKAHKTMWKGKQTVSKTLRMWEFALRLFLLVMPEADPIMSHVTTV